jgi:hypothetical protein
MQYILVLLVLLFTLFFGVSAFDQTAVLLNWNASTDNVGVAGYHVYRNGILVGTSTTTTFTDTGLDPSTQYTYAVSAFDAAGNESARSTAVTVTTLGAFNIGINIGAISYYNNKFIYSDVANAFAGNFGAWDNMSNNAAVALDSTGAPTVAGQAKFPASYPAVPMTLSWQGTGTIVPDSKCTAGAITSSGGNNQQTVTCPQVTTPAGDPSFGPPWYYLNATPPVTNIHLRLPSSSSNGMFTTDFINKMQSFSTLRFMDLFNTNFSIFTGSVNPTTNWSDRTWPVSGSRYQPQGMAYEDVIALANLTGKAIWINIPTLATDDYVCRLARLLHFGEPSDKSNSSCNPSAAGSGTVTSLNANITVYVEHSNELWNYAFPGAEQIYCWANGVAASGHSCPSGTTPTSAIGAAALATAPWTGGFSGDPYGKATTYSMFLAKRNHDIFATVFGSDAGQIKTLYNAQSGSGIVGAYSGYLDFMTTNYGAVNGYISTVAIAPYLYLSNNADLSSVDAIFSDLNAVLSDTSSAGIGATFSAALTLAQKYNMGLATYEGGQSLTGNNTTVCQANADPRMFTVYTNYFNLWDQKVGRATLFNHFEFVNYCASGGQGQWGALINQADACSQKWAVLMNLTSGTPCTP